MLRKLTSLLLVFAFAFTMFTLPAAADDDDDNQGRRNRAKGNLPIPLNIADSRVLAATFFINKFARDNGKLLALGTIIANVNDGSGPRTVVLNGVAGQVTSARSTLPGSAPVASLAKPNGTATPMQLGPPPAGACPILDLQIAPIDLNLLGLVVRTDTIALQLFAQPGAGNLLGNLLCAITGLLDPGGALPAVQSSLNQIVSILNQILAALA